MEQTWRWYGPNDPVSLDDVRRAGATGGLTLHHVAGSLADQSARGRLLAEKGLVWSRWWRACRYMKIKTHSGDWRRHNRPAISRRYATSRPAACLTASATTFASGLDAHQNLA